MFVCTVTVTRNSRVRTPRCRVFAGTAGCRAVATEAPTVTVEVDPVRVQPAWRPGRSSARVAATGCSPDGVMPALDGSMGWRIRFVRGGLGAATVGRCTGCDGDGAAAQSVCGGANLGCVGGARRRVRASTDRRWESGCRRRRWRGWQRRAAGPGWRRCGRGLSVWRVRRRQVQWLGPPTVSSCRGWPCWSRLPRSSAPRPGTGRCRLGRDRGRCPREDPPYVQTER